MQVLNVTYAPPSAIKPRPSNPRRHSKRQIKQLAASIREFGFVNPVLVDEENVLIAGHGRLVAAQMAGLELVPVIQLAGLTDAQKSALMVADNKLAENATWDPELLTATLRDLVDINYDVELTGFDTGDIDKLLRFTDGPGPADDADEVAEPDRELPAVSRQGDTWVLGEHRLHCGDALQAASYEAVLGGDKAQMVFTDPPYNVQIDGHASGLGETRHRDFAMASGEMSEAEFIAFLKASTSLMARFSENGSLHFVCIDWRHLYELLAATREVYAEQKNLCVWSKSNAGMGSLYRSRHELIPVFKNGRAPHINNVELGRRGRHRSNVWEYPGASSFGKTRDEDLQAHPTVSRSRSSLMPSSTAPSPTGSCSIPSAGRAPRSSPASAPSAGRRSSRSILTMSMSPSSASKRQRRPPPSTPTPGSASRPYGPPVPSRGEEAQHEGQG